MERAGDARLYPGPPLRNSVHDRGWRSSMSQVAPKIRGAKGREVPIAVRARRALFPLTPRSAHSIQHEPEVSFYSGGSVRKRFLD